MGIYPSPGLSIVQTALLEERIKQMELAELQQQSEEDSKADMESKRLCTQAREDQRLQEEVHQAREAMTKQLY